MPFKFDEQCDKTGSETLQRINRPETASQVSGQWTGNRIGNVKDNHANVALALDGYGSILVNQYHRDALDAIHQPSAGLPEINRNAIKLTTDPEKAIRSWQGLPNFVDAARYNVVPDSGLTASTPWRLGTNPTSCCPVPYVVNVACTGNDDGDPLTVGNDIYYEATLTKINGNFKNLVVSSTVSEFPTTIQVGVYVGPPFGFIPIGGTPHTSGNGQWIVIQDSAIKANVVGSTAQFQIIVNANSLGAVGNFKTKIFTEFPDPDDNIANCCRMAIDGTETDRFRTEPDFKKQTSKPDWKMYPNPAGNQLFVETAEVGHIDILDQLGRKVVSGFRVQGTISIPLDHLPNGIYQVKLTTSSGVSSLTLSIQK